MGSKVVYLLIKEFHILDFVNYDYIITLEIFDFEIGQYKAEICFELHSHFVNLRIYFCTR